MKKQIKNRTLATTAALALSALALAGCGKSDNNGNIVAPPPMLPPVMPVPGVPGMPGVPVFPGSAGCIPLNQPIPFQGNNIYFDWANMVGGRSPQSGQQAGTVVTGGPIIQQGSHHTYGGDGTIIANITPGGAYPGQVPFQGYSGNNNWNNYASPQYGMNPYNTNYGGYSAKTANIQGTLTIGALALQDIQWKFGNGGMTNNNYFAFPSNIPYQPYNSYYYPGYPGTPPGITAPINNVCVSQIAFDLGHWDSQGLIYGGRVYLYLNNTEHGYILWF